MQLALAETVCGPGQLMVGSWLSLTVTVNEQLAVLPPGSVTVYCTVEVPFKNIPLASPDPLRVVAPVML